MTLTIGRFATQRDPAQIEHNGDSLSFSGLLFATSLLDVETQRQQLLGLDRNEDEPDVPVTWTRDAELNGYYTVKSVSVTPIRAVTYNQFKFGYAIQLERVQGGFALPLCEVAASLALRTNAVAVSTPSGQVWVPSTASFRAARFSDGQISFMPSNAASLRNSEAGPVLSAQFQIGTSPTFVAVTSAAAPAEYYDGSAMIEQSVGGVWYPVVGDQIGNVIGNLLRIGNGLVRATFHTDGAITSEIFDGTVWESLTSFSVMVASGTLPWVAEGGWRILRNDPAACTIRTSAQYDLTSGNNFPASLTLHIERGKMLFEVYIDNTFYAIDLSTDASLDSQLRANTATAATALTGGIRQTSNNAQGHRWFLMSPSVVTNDLVNGRITIAPPSVPTVAQFGIGWELNGSSASAINTAVLNAQGFFAVSSTRQRVVSK